MKDFMAILLGSDDNVYGFARSIHELYGIKPIALATHQLEPTKNSQILVVKCIPNLHEGNNLILELNKLSKELKKEYKKLFIIPCSDAYMELLVKYQRDLKGYENEFISYKELKEFNDKESFYKLCDKYNLLYPKSKICTKENYKKVLKKIDYTYPLILKPNNSNSLEYLEAEFENKEKVYFIDDLNALTSTIENIYSSSYKDDLIIQEYVHGDDTFMRVLNVYSDKYGKVKMMSLGQPILEEYHPKTYGNYAAILSKREHISLMDDIKNFLEAINYKGAANFDIKMDEKTHKYYVFEINPRPGRSSFFTYPAGCSFAECYVEDLVYGDLKPKIDNKEEILWLNVPLILVHKYVKNKEILSKVKELKSKNKIYHTLRYKNDNSIKRIMTCSINYLRKIKYYPKYYIDKK